MKENGNMLAFALLVTLSGQVLYHVIAKESGGTRYPLQLVSIAYMVSFLVVTTIGAGSKQITFEHVPSWHDIARGSGLGIAVACIEVGFMFAYRSGLPISIGALGVLAVTTLILAPIGIVFFSEALTVRMIVGGSLAMIGVWLMKST